MHRYLLLLLACSALIPSTAQVCDPAGNLFLVSNYDGGIVTINVDQDIPNLVIGISTYEPVQVTITGPFATNVVQVLYAGMNSSQNNNNCGQGNFTSSITGVDPGIVTINPPMQPPQVGYTPAHGNGTGSWGGVVIGAAGGCDTTVNTGGVNTPDELVFHFEDQTGASLYAHYTQYACWQNDVIDISAGGTCCIDATPPVVNGCDPNGNVLIYSNYEGGTLTINVDQDIPDLRIGICTYEAVQVNIIGPFAANVTEVIYAGFDGNNGPCGTNPPTTTINGVPPGIVTQYSQTLGNIAIANFLGEPLAPGFPPLVNCITGAEGECSTSNSGGGNSAPQIASVLPRRVRAGRRALRPPGPVRLFRRDLQRFRWRQLLPAGNGHAAQPHLCGQRHLRLHPLDRFAPVRWSHHHRPLLLPRALPAAHLPGLCVERRHHRPHHHHHGTGHLLVHRGRLLPLRGWQLAHRHRGRPPLLLHRWGRHSEHGHQLQRRQ